MSITEWKSAEDLGKAADKLREFFKGYTEPEQKIILRLYRNLQEHRLYGEVRGGIE